jgi:hypothetical protein
MPDRPPAASTRSCRNALDPAMAGTIRAFGSYYMQVQQMVNGKLIINPVDTDGETHELSQVQ